MRHFQSIPLSNTNSNPRRQFGTKKSRGHPKNTGMRMTVNKNNDCKETPVLRASPHGAPLSVLKQHNLPLSSSHRTLSLGTGWEERNFCSTASAELTPSST